MPWVNIDDGFDEHPKVEGLLEDDLLRGLASVGLFTLLLSRSCRRLTDGIVSRRHVSATAGEFSHDLTERLRSAGLIDEAEGQLSIHDYLDWNPSKAQVEAKRAKRSAAGKAAADARWSAPGNAEPDASTHNTPHDAGTVMQHAPLHSTTTPLQATPTPTQGVGVVGAREPNDRFRTAMDRERVEFARWYSTLNPAVKRGIDGWLSDQAPTWGTDQIVVHAQRKAAALEKSARTKKAPTAAANDPAKAARIMGEFERVVESGGVWSSVLANEATRESAGDAGYRGRGAA